MKFVWKDDALTASTENRYTVKNDNNEIVYEGHFPIFDGSSYFYLNRLAQKLMGKGTVDFTTGVTSHPEMSIGLTVYNENEQALKNEVYVNAFNGEPTNYLSNPINGKLDPRMMFLWTLYSDEAIEIAINGPQPPQPEFSLQLSGATAFTYEQQSSEIKVVQCTDWDGVSISKSGSWFSYTKTRTGVILSINKNETQSARTGSISFSYGGSVYTSLTLTQSVYVPSSFVLEFSGSTTFSYSYQSSLLYLSACTDWSAVRMEYSSDWLTASKLNQGVYLVLQRNEGNIRTVPLNFYNGNQLVKTVVITQRAENTNYQYQYLTFEIQSSNNQNIALAFSDGSNSSTPLSISYRKNGGDWNTGYFGSVSIPVDSGDIVEFKGNNSAYAWNAYSGYTTYFVRNRFFTDAACNIYGNIMSLVYGDNFIGKTGIAERAFAGLFYGFGIRSAEHLVLPSTTLAEYCYQEMFSGCYRLTTAPELPATTLADYCYEEMFEACAIQTAPSLPATTLADYCYRGMFFNCGSLVNAPSLTATTLGQGCYKSMFAGCTSLISAPALPATTLENMCYERMFEGCISLVNAPVLPATTLGQYCYYYMFKGCTSLVNAPDLPAITLVYRCYAYMFEGCTSLQTAPALSATTLYAFCYAGMFKGCTSLQTAPELPVVTLADYCYYDMFSGCTALNYVKCLAETFKTASTSGWLSGVSQTGTFVKKQGVTWETGASGIPSGWTVEEAV